MVFWMRTILEISVLALTRFLIMWMQRLPCLPPVTTAKKRSFSSKVQPKMCSKHFLLYTLSHIHTFIWHFVGHFR